MDLFHPLRQFFNFLTSEPTVDHTLCKSCGSVRKNNFTESVTVAKPPTYPCLKAVIGNLEANIRIELSQRCPLLRSVDQHTPLKIKTLSVDRFGLKINSHTYYLDVAIIRETKETRAQLSSRELMNFIVEREAIISPNSTDNSFRNGRDADMCRCAPRVSSYIEWLAFPRRHEEALSYLCKKVLGNRNSPIKVNTLDITSVVGILGDLGTLKFKTKKLKIDLEAANTLSTIFPIFVESCFPLSCLELQGMFLNWHEEDIYSHPIIKTAKVIKIPSFTNVLHRFSNLRVHADFRYWEFSNEIVIFIDYWLHNGKEVGAHFSFTMYTANANDALNFWEEVKTKYIDRMGEEHRSIRPFEPLIIPTRFFSTICFNIVKGTGYEWICNVEVRSV